LEPTGSTITFSKALDGRAVTLVSTKT
jgi:hypothetical protein